MDTFSSCKNFGNDELRKSPKRPYRRQICGDVQMETLGIGLAFTMI